MPQICLSIENHCDSIQLGACHVQSSPVNAQSLTADQTTEPAIIHLVGRDGHMPGQQNGSWKWLCFQAHHTKNQVFSFSINDQFEPGTERLNDHHMLYKPLNNSAPWRAFDWHRHDQDAGTYTFGNHTPCEHSAIQVAYGVTYSPDECWAWLTSLHDQSLIRPTPASSNQYTIGHTAAGTDDLDRAWPPMPIPAFRMSSDIKLAHKKHIVLMTGVHPNESPANYVLQGAVNALTASPILERATIDVYPMVNPSGRAAGLNRTTLKHTDRDSNRVWREDLYRDMADIRSVAEAIQTNLNGQAPDLFIDFHSWCDPRTVFMNTRFGKTSQRLNQTSA